MQHSVYKATSMPLFLLVLVICFLFSSCYVTVLVSSIVLSGVIEDTLWEEFRGRYIELGIIYYSVIVDYVI